MEDSKAINLDKVSAGERVERRGRVQGLRGQEDLQTLSLVKDKCHHGDP